MDKGNLCICWYQWWSKIEKMTYCEVANTSPSCSKLHTLCFIYLLRLACLWSEMSMFQWAGMREGGEPLQLAFQYLILRIWRPCYLNLVMMSSLASKCQDFKVWMPVFQPFYVMKLKTPMFKLYYKKLFLNSKSAACKRERLIVARVR